MVDNNQEAHASNNYKISKPCYVFNYMVDYKIYNSSSSSTTNYSKYNKFYYNSITYVVDYKIY